MPKYYSIVIGANKWEPVYSGYTYNKKNEKILSNSLTHWLANILSKKIPSCWISFKRHKLYATKSMSVAKFWFYCTIEGCQLNGFCWYIPPGKKDLLHCVHTFKSKQSNTTFAKKISQYGCGGEKAALVILKVVHKSLHTGNEMVFLDCPTCAKNFVLSYRYAQFPNVK